MESKLRDVVVTGTQRAVSGVLILGDRGDHRQLGDGYGPLDRSGT